MKFLLILTVLICIMINLSKSQRPSYAGSRPSNGYRDKYKPIGETTPEPDILTNRFDPNQMQQPPLVSHNVVQPAQVFIPTINEGVQTQDELSNRNSFDTTTSRLPFDALGDKELVDRLSQLPIDQQPFWFINAHTIEAHRNRSSNQQGSTNILAERGSFAGVPAGIPIANQNANLLLQNQQSQIRNRPPIPLNQNIVMRNPNENILNNNLLNTRSNFNDNQQSSMLLASLLQPVNIINSSGNKFIYLSPQLENQLRNAQLIP